MNHNGLMVQRWRVRCAKCNTSVLLLAQFADEIWLTCTTCKKSWAKAKDNDGQDVITLIGGDPE